MSITPVTFKPDITELVMDHTDILRELGYSADCPDTICQAIDELRSQAPSHIDIACGYCRYPVVVRQHQFECEGITFSCGPLITRHLNACTEIVLFACTLGKPCDDWIKGFFDQEDPFQGYISNTIGSLMVEAVADWLEARLQEALNPEGLSRSRRMSPGYCHWDVKEQHKLFALLPEHFCGISLLESALMIPIKSVTGVIGIGRDIPYLDYECHVCDRKDCIMRHAHRG